MYINRQSKESISPLVVMCLGTRDTRKWFLENLNRIRIQIHREVVYRFDNNCIIVHSFMSNRTLFLGGLVRTILEVIASRAGITFGEILTELKRQHSSDVTSPEDIACLLYELFLLSIIEVEVDNRKCYVVNESELYCDDYEN